MDLFVHAQSSAIKGATNLQINWNSLGPPGEPQSYEFAFLPLDTCRFYVTLAKAICYGHKR